MPGKADVSMDGVHDAVDRPRDRHLDAVTLRQFGREATRVDAFDHDAHLVDDVVELAALSQLLPAVAIPAEGAEAGGEKVAYGARGDPGRGMGG
jgi:hypothetical protein